MPVLESGVPGYEYYVWFGLWTPKKTPPSSSAKADDPVLRNEVMRQR